MEKKKPFLSSLFGLLLPDTYSAIVEAVWTLEPGGINQQLFSQKRRCTQRRSCSKSLKLVLQLFFIVATGIK